MRGSLSVLVNFIRRDEIRFHPLTCIRDSAWRKLQIEPTAGCLELYSVLFWTYFFRAVFWAKIVLVDSTVRVRVKVMNSFIVCLFCFYSSVAPTDMPREPSLFIYLFIFFLSARHRYVSRQCCKNGDVISTVNGCCALSMKEAEKALTI